MRRNERSARGQKAALVGIFGSLLLSGVKLFAGLVASSTAVVADALHSFSDILVSAITWFGIKVSGKPPDEAHPYGHGDVEPIVGLIISIVLVIIGFELARHSIGIIYFHPAPPGPLALYITAFAIIIKEWISRYTLKIASIIKSPALKADAQHHRSDVYTSVVVLIGVFGAMAGYPVLDPLAGLLVSLVIIKIGYEVGKENVVRLMGTVPSPEFGKSIQALVLSIEGVELIHRVRIHAVGAYFTVDLHVCVDESLSLTRAHKIAHKVQEEVLEHFPEVSSVLVHIEPFDLHHRKNHKSNA